MENSTKTNSKWYVTMTDKFMSNWGKAEGKTNKLIFVCDSLEQAEIVKENAENRSDQKFINICSKRPSYYREECLNTDGVVVGNKFVQVKTNDDYSAWYKKDFFKKD